MVIVLRAANLSGGDYLLAPAYGLLNTSIHVDEEDFALKEELMPEDVWSDAYARTGYPCAADFITFGLRISVLPKKLEDVISMFSQDYPVAKELIDRSYLNERSRRMYWCSYQKLLHRFLRKALII